MMRSALPLALACWATASHAGEVVSPFVSLHGFTVKKDKSHIISNLPPLTDQGSLPLCFAHAAATVYNYYVCKGLGQDCASAPKSALASPLDITRYASRPENNEGLEYSSSYPAIRISGGSALYTLEKAALFAGEVASQQCAPYESFFIGTASTGQGVADTVVLSQNETLASLEAFYKKYNPPCSTQCPPGTLEELGAILPNFHTDILALSRALRRESFDGFLTRLAIPANCALARNRAFFDRNDYTMGMLPPTGKKSLSYTQYRKAIIDAVKRDNPVILEGICLSAKKKNGKCDDMHALVVYGYAELCDAERCYTGLKLRSSWGQEWQAAADERWYDAKALFERSAQLEGMVGWLTPVAKKK